MSLEPGRFVIDGLEGTFDGFTDGQTWNGWACPVFPGAESDRILEAFNREAGRTVARYDESSDTYVYEEDGNDPVAFGPAPERVHGVALYEIGTAYWTWGRVNGTAGQSGQ